MFNSQFPATASACYSLLVFNEVSRSGEFLASPASNYEGKCNTVLKTFAFGVSVVRLARPSICCLSLFVEPNILEAPIVIDRVLVKYEAL
jgi:hypothetical protein